MQKRNLARYRCLYDVRVYHPNKLTYEEVKIVDPAFALTDKEYEKYKLTE